uniref:Uncharacterized LOC100180669 n=1 Tax=Ciona intestinalis TaxID=7719 RepID=H2XRW0_CIOIN|nr:uncharacterized protein LOC100180669 isoform X1 [Ciona intestinalis]|eukprot:XP_002130846.1 uncharacterized protein LOC100180669 isoform X1 [Ciona intestinalis]
MSSTTLMSRVGILIVVIICLQQQQLTQGIPLSEEIQELLKNRVVSNEADSSDISDYYDQGLAEGNGDSSELFLWFIYKSLLADLKKTGKNNVEVEQRNKLLYPSVIKKSRHPKLYFPGIVKRSVQSGTENKQTDETTF